MEKASCHTCPGGIAGARVARRRSLPTKQSRAKHRKRTFHYNSATRVNAQDCFERSALLQRHGNTSLSTLSRDTSDPGRRGFFVSLTHTAHRTIPRESGRLDLNQRPHRPKRCALPTAPRPGDDGEYMPIPENRQTNPQKRMETRIWMRRNRRGTRIGPPLACDKRDVLSS